MVSAGGPIASRVILQPATPIVVINSAKQTFILCHGVNQSAILIGGAACCARDWSQNTNDTRMTVYKQQ